MRRHGAHLHTGSAAFHLGGESWGCFGCLVERRSRDGPHTTRLPVPGAQLGGVYVERTRREMETLPGRVRQAGRAPKAPSSLSPVGGRVGEEPLEPPASGEVREAEG